MDPPDATNPSPHPVAVFCHRGVGILRQPHALLPEGCAGALHVGRTAGEIRVLGPWGQVKSGWLDWFKGKSTGQPNIWWEKTWFPFL